MHHRRQIDIKIYSKRKEMNTKKLVFGFCLLAAVTGAAPQVLGMKTLRIPARNLLTKRIPDSERRGAYVETLKDAVLKLINETSCFVKMSNYEVENVKLAALSELKSSLCYKKGYRELRLARENVSGIQNALMNAEVERIDSFFTKLKTAKVDRLRLKLTEALQQEKLMHGKYTAFCRNARIFAKKAEESWIVVYGYRKQQSDYLAALNDSYLSLANNIKADLDRVYGLNSNEITVPELELMMVNAIRCIAILQETARRRTFVSRVDERLRDVDWCFRDAADRLGVSYRKLKDSYCQLDCYPGAGELLQLMDQLRLALRPALELEKRVRDLLTTKNRIAALTLVGDDAKCTSTLAAPVGEKQPKVVCDEDELEGIADN
jgi:hypothetical protein